MSSVLYRLGSFAARRRWAVIAVALAAVIGLGTVAAGAMGSLSLARFQMPGSESVRAAELLEREFGTGGADLVLLVTARRGSVDSPAVARDGTALTRELAAQRGTGDVESYWSRGAPAIMRSVDGRQAVILARLPGDPTRVRDQVLPALTERFAGEQGAVRVQLTGGDEVFRQVGEQARRDFLRAEVIIFVLSFALLLLLLRRVTAALLPIGVGAFAMIGTLAALRALTAVTEISTFAANLTLVLGLGLGIDYGLFMIYRFREEIAAGRPPYEAVARATERAGRAVVFSGVTVAAALAALLVFPYPFLRSFAYAGIGVVLFGIVAALVVLPALLAVAGRRIGADRPAGAARWRRIAAAVLRRPVVLGVAAVIVLLALAAPALQLRFGNPDDRMLPASAAARQAQEQIRGGFTAEKDDALQIVARRAGGERSNVGGYAAALSRVPGVAQVDSAAGSFTGGRETGPGSTEFTGRGGTWLSVIPAESRLRADPDGLVRDVRAVPAPFDVLVGGYPAELADFRAALVDRIPAAIGLILTITLVILFLMTGSILLPVKATVLNLVSLSVLFGALVWIFQQGNLSGPLGFTATGTLDTTIPVLMFCVAYGLSMDYEVLVLARIKEAYDQTGDSSGSVIAGIGRSGPLVTSAALVLALAFAVYATSGVVYLKMLGIGIALTVLSDALLIRGVLVPAFMRLAGTANWWAPAPLRRLHTRIGHHETAPVRRSVPFDLREKSGERAGRDGEVRAVRVPGVPDADGGG